MAITKKGTFNLWLVNTAPGNEFYWGEGTMWAVGSHLETMFKRVIAHKSCPFMNFYYSWEKGSVSDTDIVLYFLKSPAYSLISGQAKHASASGATYKSPTGMISEVYLNAMEGDRDYSLLVANLAFHECMHNKIDAASSSLDMHVGADGLAAPVVVRGTPLTDGNVSKMAGNMGKANPQHIATMAAQTKYLY